MTSTPPLPNGNQTADGKFAPGNKLGRGRIKGSRNKIAESFLSALHADFEEHGPAVIEKVREERPQDYLKVVASILPKELNIRVEDELSDAELDQRIRELAAALRIESGIGEAAGGKTAQTSAQPAGKVPSVH